jgi:hypothetical protein
MAWLISLTFLLLYLLGLFAFNAPPAVHVLIVLAVLAPIVDYLLAGRFRK